MQLYHECHNVLATLRTTIHIFFFFFSSRRRHTRFKCDWSSDVCSSDLCLFSSSTRNIALGSGSITVAITSMASSLEFPESPFFFSSRIGLAIVSRVYLAGLAPGHCNSYHDGPVISFGRVRIHGPLAATA